MNRSTGPRSASDLQRTGLEIWHSAGKQRPAAELDELRTIAPMWRAESDGVRFTVLLGRSTVVEALRDWRHWGSIGMSLDVNALDELPLWKRGISAIDPPIHRRFRRLVREAVAPVDEDQVEFIRDIARRATAQLPLGVPADVVPWAGSIVSEAVAGQLGIAARDMLAVETWTRAVIGTDPAERAEAARSLFAFTVHEIRSRRRSATLTDDGIGRLLAAKDRLEPDLPDGHLCNLIITLLFAGNVESRYLVVNTVAALARDPAEYSSVRRHPAQVSGVVDRALWRAAPQRDTPRRCVSSTTLDGVEFLPGDIVVASLLAANRDEACSPATPSVAFGAGVHRCPGEPVARAIAEIAIQELASVACAIEYAPGWAFASTEFDHIHGPETLDLILTAEDRGA